MKSELAILAFAVILRVAIVTHTTWYAVADTRDYHAFAYNLIVEGEYKHEYHGEQEEYRGFTFYAFRLPGYPVFLAAIYCIFGWNQYYAYLANIVCDTVSAILVMLTTRRLFGRSEALVAGGLFAVHVLWTPILMTECLFTALFLMLVFLVVIGAQTRSTGHALLFGCILTAAFFVRPIAIAVVPVVVFHIFRSKRLTHSSLLYICMLLPLGFCVTLWTFRNYQRLGEFVPASTNLGFHNARDFGINTAFMVMALRTEGMNEAQIDRILRKSVIALALDRPLTSIRIYSERIFNLFSLDPAWEVENAMRRGLKGPNASRLIEALYRKLCLQYYFTYPLALGGVAILLVRRRPLHGIGVLVGSYTLLQSLLSPNNIRFAAPLYPLFCLFGAYATTQTLSFVYRSSLGARGPSTGRAGFHTCWPADTIENTQRQPNRDEES